MLESAADKVIKVYLTHIDLIQVITIALINNLVLILKATRKDLKLYHLWLMDLVLLIMSVLTGILQEEVKEV